MKSSDTIVQSLKTSQDPASGSNPRAEVTPVYQNTRLSSHRNRLKTQICNPKEEFMAGSNLTLPNHELPPCKQSDGSYKKSHPTKEAAETFAKSVFERYGGEKLQRPYQCESDPGHWHLSSQDEVALEDRTSAPYTMSVFPVAPLEETDGGQRDRSTSAAVEERRHRVRAAVTNNPDKTYALLAEELGLAQHIFNSDVNTLVEQGLLPRRKSRSDSPSKALSAADQLAQIEAEFQRLSEQRTKAIAAVEAEERERIEREKVHVDWVNGNTGTELSVRKKGQLIVFPVAVWKEIVTAVNTRIQDK